MSTLRVQSDLSPDDFIGMAHPIRPWLFAPFVIDNEDGTFTLEFEAPRVAMHNQEEVMRWVRRRRQGKE